VPIGDIEENKTSDQVFLKACELAGAYADKQRSDKAKDQPVFKGATRRQAGKFRKGLGLAFKFKTEAIKACKS